MTSCFPVFSLHVTAARTACAVEAFQPITEFRNDDELSSMAAFSDAI